MMIKRTVLGAAIALSLSMAVTTVQAQELQSGWYFGGSFGEATADLDQDELDFVATAFANEFGVITSADSSLEDSDSSFTVFAGYKFNPYIGVEAGYVNLGAAEYRATGTVNPPGPITNLPVQFGMDFEATGFTIAAAGFVPLGQMFDLHARLGYFISDMEIKFTGSALGESASETLDGSDEELFYSIGLGFKLGTNWSLSLDFARYSDVGNEDDTGEGDIDNLSLSLLYRI